MLCHNIRPMTLTAMTATSLRATAAEVSINSSSQRSNYNNNNLYTNLLSAPSIKTGVGIARKIRKKNETTANHYRPYKATKADNNY